MPYVATLGDQEFRVEIREEDGAFSVRLGEREIPVDVLSLGSGLYSLLIKGFSFEVDVMEGEESLIVMVRGQAFPVSVHDGRRRLSRGVGQGATGAGLRRITAPMSGKVTRHLVRVGDKVEAGDGVIVLEAMKMENELKAPSVGAIKEIMVSEGTVVKGGDVLVVFE